MSMERTPVPSYRRPPIIEAVWSVQFAEMAWLLPPHTGLFWGLVRDRFPRCEEQPPIAHIVETEDLFSVPISRAEMISGWMLGRQWFLSESGTELLQLQRDRFCCNWRKVEATDVYPRFEHLRGLFESGWGTFCGFVKTMGQAAPAIDQCELTYINHIDKGRGWEAVGGIGDVFPVVRWEGTKAFLPPPLTLGARLAFDLPDLGGRLHVSLRHARKPNGASDGNPDAGQLLLLELTVRGMPRQTDLAGLLEWFALGRETIVRGFTDLTTPPMHSLWERER